MYLKLTLLKTSIVAALAHHIALFVLNGRGRFGCIQERISANTC